MGMFQCDEKCEPSFLFLSSQNGAAKLSPESLLRLVAKPFSLFPLLPRRIMSIPLAQVDKLSFRVRGGPFYLAAPDRLSSLFSGKKIRRKMPPFSII